MSAKKEVEIEKGKEKEKEASQKEKVEGKKEIKQDKSGRTQSMKALEKVDPSKEQKYVVYTVVYNKDINRDGRHGDILCVGCYPTFEKAKMKIQELMSSTGHDSFILTETGKWNPLQEGNAKITPVFVNKSNNVVEGPQSSIGRKEDPEETKKKFVEDLTQEKADENNKDHIEFFKHHCYLSIKNRAKLEYLRAQLVETEKCYQKHIEEAKAHYARHPEHEKEWLPCLKEKLEKRGEKELYSKIEAGYKFIRPQIVGTK